MKPSDVINIVGDTPHTTHAQGRSLYDLIVKHRLTRCMEMGFAHGVGTVWIAAALDEIGGGKVVSIDNESAHIREPSAIDMVKKSGLEKYVELHYDESSYNWHIHNNWQEYHDDKFDLIFVDGAHKWDLDALAFFLGDSILNTGGWFLFDDLYWSYAGSPSLRGLPMVQAMSPAMRETKQVQSVWERLVLTNPRYGNFLDDGTRGWAQKQDEAASDTRSLTIQRPDNSLPTRAVRKLSRMLGV